MWCPVFGRVWLWGIQTYNSQFNRKHIWKTRWMECFLFSWHTCFAKQDRGRKWRTNDKTTVPPTESTWQLTVCWIDLDKFDCIANICPTWTCIQIKKWFTQHTYPIYFSGDVPCTCNVTGSIAHLLSRKHMEAPPKHYHVKPVKVYYTVYLCIFNWVPCWLNDVE